MNPSNSSNLRWIVIFAIILAVSAAAIFTLRRPQAASDEAPAAATASTGRVAFLMEQQWLIKLKLAKAEEARMAPQILSTGRIVAVPAKHAFVAPPVGGILQGATLPHIGQPVRQGQR